jgi:hypothetical protein
MKESEDRPALEFVGYQVKAFLDIVRSKYILDVLYAVGSVDGAKVDRRNHFGSVYLVGK